jgi:hypothetical protein
VSIEAPRDDLIRGVTELRADGDGNTMVGYPIVYDTWTRIDSWEGEFLERIRPGSVNKTLKERGERVKVQFDHGMHPVIGSLPIGKPDVMRSDDLGLWTETPLSHATDVQTLIKPRLQEGTLDGMSFRFSIVSEDWKHDPDESDHNPKGIPERTVNELRLYEFGPVTWPAYEATQVGIRTQAAFAAWMAQTPEERSGILHRFDLEPSREIIRIRSGAVIIDTPEPAGDDPEPSPAEGHEERNEDNPSPPDGHEGEQEQQDAPAERHESTDPDAPAEGHESTSVDEEREAARTAGKAKARDKVLAEFAAAMAREPLA